MHTSAKARKDCRVNVDGAPTIFCFHADGKALRSGDLMKCRVVRAGLAINEECRTEIMRREEMGTRWNAFLPSERLGLESLRAHAERFRQELFDAFLGGVYLLGHGLIKVLLVAGLWRDRLWAFPVSLVFLGAFIVDQAYRISLHFSAALLCLTLFDLGVAFLIWREYHYVRHHT